MSLRVILQGHIDLILEAKGITADWGDGLSPRASRSERHVWLTPIKGRGSYYTALHELGHILGPNPPRRLEQEVVAWRWALEYGIKPPTPGVWKMIHRSLSAYVARAERWQSMKLPAPDHDFWALLSEAAEHSSK